MSDDRLPDYLLGELDPAERAAFEAELREDEQLRAEAERLAPVVARLEGLEPAAWEQLPPLPALPPLPTADDAPAARPGPDALVAAELRVAPAARRCARERPARARGRRRAAARRGRRRRCRVGGGRRGPRPARGPGRRRAGHGDARLVARTARRCELRGLPPSEPGQFYELWLLNTVDDMVAIGSFSVPESGEIDVTVPLPGDAGRFAALDLSVEPDDGDPAHSTVSVLRAPLQGS